MRKWLRGRGKGRKKPSEAAPAPAVPPLQPAYFDANDQQSAEPEPAPVHVTAAEPAEPEATEPREEAAPGEAATDSEGRPKRRRRRRGGRAKKSGSTALSGAAEAAPVEHEPVAAPFESAPEQVSEPETAAEPVAPGAAARTGARPSRGVVVLAIGLPGSGKSSWFRRHNISPLSSDLLRALLFDDPTEQRFQDLVFSNLRSMLKARLIARRPMNYVDATNLTPHERHSWIKLAKDFGYEVQGVFFDVPVEVCLERNQRRKRMVSDDVMRRMASKLRPPTFEEGFSKLTVVRVKAKE
jgi:predicted kinase